MSSEIPVMLANPYMLSTEAYPYLSSSHSNALDTYTQCSSSGGNQGVKPTERKTGQVFGGSDSASSSSNILNNLYYQQQQQQQLYYHHHPAALYSVVDGNGYYYNTVDHIPPPPYPPPPYNIGPKHHMLSASSSALVPDLCQYYHVNNNSSDNNHNLSLHDCCDYNSISSGVKPAGPGAYTSSSCAASEESAKTASASTVTQHQDRISQQAVYSDICHSSGSSDINSSSSSNSSGGSRDLTALASSSLSSSNLPVRMMCSIYIDPGYAGGGGGVGMDNCNALNPGEYLKTSEAS